MPEAETTAFAETVNSLAFGQDEPTACLLPFRFPRMLKN
jgi:hypothetical protein